MQPWRFEGVAATTATASRLEASPSTRHPRCTHLLPTARAAWSARCSGSSAPPRGCVEWRARCTAAGLQCSAPRAAVSWQGYRASGPPAAAAAPADTGAAAVAAAAWRLRPAASVAPPAAAPAAPAACGEWWRPAAQRPCQETSSYWKKEGPPHLPPQPRRRLRPTLPRPHRPPPAARPGGRRRQYPHCCRHASPQRQQ